MFGVFKTQPPKSIDLAAIRDTLLYIESDLDTAPDLQRLGDAVRSALAEIDRIELSGNKLESADVMRARFVPVNT